MAEARTRPMKRALGTLVRKADAPEAGADKTARGLRELKRLTRRSVREQEQTQLELRALRDDVTGLRSELQRTREAVMAGLQVAVDDEPQVRRLLDQVRASAGYDDPWDAPDPLVSVVIPT